MKESSYTERKTVTLACRFSERMHACLVEEAEREGTTVSALVRRYIREAVARSKRGKAQDESRRHWLDRFCDGGAS